MLSGKNKITLQAQAKINLFLQVLKRRADGYHDLETWMQKLDLYDTVTVEVAGNGSEIEFSCDDPALSDGKENLAVKGAIAFFSALKLEKQPQIKIHLEKRIPVAAGLGGGSSDAGAVIRGLNRLFDSPFSESELIDLARPLGADVPFFVIEKNAVFAGGIGDIMYPVDSLREYFFVLVNPGFFVSTKWVFEKLSLTSENKKYTFASSQKRKAKSLSLKIMHNDLEKITSARYSEIESIKQALMELGATRAMMSGSGPTVFGVFPDTEKPSSVGLEGIVGELSKRFGDKVFVARANTGAWPSG